MSKQSYYHCQHCREEVAMEIKCPCCSLGKPKASPSDELLSWLRVHVSGYKMRLDAMWSGHDQGYIKACEVISAELRRLIEEHKDGGDRVTRNQGLLDTEVPSCGDNTLP
jgi:hypothetical protein